ncbi:glycerophosphodiester phosphodiesterase [Bythopirellula goksoeyrii]|uniref:Glycerophosphoryl diester phosphodiesterase n=1 Tax=Bythopirellula goksoeyrii TaxID=1400387 RepID=A0A5B9Q889_9BACT|nr:glycerophosphodiester phosphodiesterase [Bythopirellula goksoeyrii]QEG35274.1 Glycerophosphoryl diester phosphodiesterase [Bythopirellula goksoeyrii]
MNKSIWFLVLVVCHTIGINSQIHAQLLVAHRGASAEAPENSLSSFQLAWEEDADAIEGDFYLTSDEQIVCIHDETTKRVSDVDMKVSNSTLEQLQKLDVGSWKDSQYANERIPTIQDVLATIPFGKSFFIEIKCGPEILPILKPILLDSGIPLSQLKIISFDEDVVKVAKQTMPDIETFWVVGFKKDKQQGKWMPTIDDVLKTAASINADGLDLKAELEVINSDVVARCRDAGLGLHAWTVDDPKLAEQLIEFGFDSVTTNRPGFLRQALVVSKTEAKQSPVEVPSDEERSTTTQAIGKE